MRLNLCKITNKAKFTDPASITYIKKLTQHIVSKVKFLSFAVCLFLAVMYLSLSILQKWKRLWVPDFLLFSSNSAFSAINSKQEYQTFNAFLLLATPGFSCVDPALGLVILLFLFHFQKQGLCSQFHIQLFCKPEHFPKCDLHAGYDNFWKYPIFHPKLA